MKFREKHFYIVRVKNKYQLIAVLGFNHMIVGEMPSISSFLNVHHVLSYSGIQRDSPLSCSIHRDSPTVKLELATDIYNESMKDDTYKHNKNKYYLKWKSYRQPLVQYKYYIDTRYSFLKVDNITTDFYKDNNVSFVNYLLYESDDLEDMMAFVEEIDVNTLRITMLDYTFLNLVQYAKEVNLTQEDFELMKVKNVLLDKRLQYNGTLHSYKEEYVCI